jgi:3-methyladenine DNA glycosylase/8-oxoguanine DNA glycosylase
MRALGEPDAFPSSDLGLLRAMAIENSRELEHRAETWRPWRAYAAMYLWKIFGEGKVRGDRAFSKNKKVTAEHASFDEPVPMVV